MQYIIKDRKKGLVEITIDTKEELPFVKRLIEPEDQVTMRSSRVSKAETGKERIVATITIKVEKVELENITLRVLGRIVWSTNENIPLNKYHSFSISEGDRFILEKNEPTESFYKLLEYIKSKFDSKEYFICSIDSDEYAFANVKGNEIKILFSEGICIDKNSSDTEVFSTFRQIIDKIPKTVKSVVFLLHPSIEKRFLEFLKNKKPELYDRSYFVKVYHGGVSGVYEAVKGGYLRNIMKASRLVKEIDEINELMKEIAKNGNVAYGPKEIEEYVEMGAVDKLYIVENKINDFKEIIDKALSKGSEVMFISHSHEHGRILEGIGGIAAKLRFKV